MKQAITHLGTKELHRRHSVMIEGGQFPRSKVMDQCIFDRYLMEGLINITHHKCAETLLSMAAKANIWAKGANLDGVYSDTPKKSKIFFGMMPFGDALKRIANECSNLHCTITKAVIIHDTDVRVHEQGISLFTDSMDFLNNNVIRFYKNPLRHLE